MKIKTASEAREETKKIIEECLITEMSEIGQKINDSINEGKYSCLLDYCFSETTIKKLKELGYNVEMGGRYNEISTSISWA